MAFARALAAAALILATAVPAAAQNFSDGYSFLKAVRDRNGDDATKLLEKPGFTAIDTRADQSGETALHIVVKRRDTAWLSYLLAKGARPDIRDNAGETPLFEAATIGYPEGASLLLRGGARPDTPNGAGETPLMRAVQAHDADTVRVLLEAGANPLAKDHVAGKTARDYALAGRPDPAIVKMLDDAKPAKPKMGPQP